MADRPRKPSDDPLFWFGVPGADEVGIYLFDVLALAMVELQQSQERNQHLSFDRVRNVLYRHMDELAKALKSRTPSRVIDPEHMKVELDLFLAISRC